MAYGYSGFSGYKDGIYDMQSARYQHRWVVVVDGSASGYYSRKEAREAFAALKSCSDIEYLIATNQI